jgi:transposase
MRENKQQIYRRYDDTFREDALALLRRSNRSMREVCTDLGIPRATLHAWYKADMAKKGKKVPRRVAATPVGEETESPEEKIARLEQELVALRRENDELKMDRAILKKAAAFFAKESE